MPEKKFEVVGDGGLKGVMFASARFLDANTERVVHLDDGRELRVPADALEPQPDGSFYLRLAPENLPKPAAGNGAASNGTADATAAATGSPIPNDAMFRETYEVEHVKVDRLMDEPASERREGDDLILPVVEEVLVVEKKYLLKEEIHIRKRRERLSDIRTVHRGQDVKQTA